MSFLQNLFVNFDLQLIFMSKYTTTVDVQTLKRDDKTFAGQPVQGSVTKVVDGKEVSQRLHEVDFALVPYNGEKLKVSEGEHLVTYADGTVEVHNDESLKKYFTESGESKQATQEQPENKEESHESID